MSEAAATQTALLDQYIACASTPPPQTLTHIVWEVINHSLLMHTRRLREAEHDYEAQRDEYERQRRYVDSYFAQVQTDTPELTSDSSSSSAKRKSGGSADISTEKQFVYKRLDTPAEVNWGCTCARAWGVQPY